MKALVVDDEMEVGELTAEIVRREGFEVDFVTDGAEALNLLRENFYDVFLGGTWARREGKALKTLGIIMGAYISCWAPFFALALAKALCGWAERCPVPIPPSLEFLVLWLGYFNSTLVSLLSQFGAL